MPTKPPLKVLKAPESPQKAPRHLEPATAAWYVTVIADYVLEAHHIRLLTLAAESWDLSQVARRQVESEGLTYLDRYNSPHPHPAVAIGRDARLSFARLVRELDLDCEPPADVRIPRRGGRN